MDEKGDPHQTQGGKINHTGVGSKQGVLTWKECRNIVRALRDGIGKSKCQMELHLARDVKANKNLYKHIGD